ncbi:MAG: HAMP domain-containing sensor histidine kinase [Pirellulales bacterium]
MELKLPEERVEIPCGPIELEIAFVNLLRNAVEAGATRIETGIESTTDGVRVVFRDNGRGITPSDLAHVLEPLYTSRASGVGTGVGLGIVHGIVVDHRGTIEFETYGTRGTSVYVVLPRE